MSKRDFVKEWCERAIDAFKNHELIDNREDRWRIARRYPDGKIDCVHAAEIVSLWGGRIYVGGDIDDCVFAYYSDKTNDHIAKLRWMGCHTDVAYYVRQKASLGLTDGGKLVDAYDSQVADDDLAYHLEQELERIEEKRELNTVQCEKEKEEVRDLFERAKTLSYDQHEMMEVLRELDGDAWEWIGNVGVTVSNRVIYAWAALRRLCELLDEAAHA